MRTSSKVLFEQLFDNQPLFKNQSDLVAHLLSDKESPYFNNSVDQEKYSKAQARLKTYVSQLLSSSVARSISEDFKSGLTVVLSKRLKGTGHDSIGVVDLIIEDLKIKNSSITKSEIKNSPIDQFQSDLSTASYIAVITSTPLEIDLDSEQSSFSLRRFLFIDLIDRLQDVNKDLKYYRFNFPMDSYASLFWRGLKRILYNYIKENRSEALFNSLYSKFTIKTDTLLNLTKIEKLEDINIDQVVNEILLLLNRNRYIMVFHANTPIYGTPLVALNPTEPKNMKVYALFEGEQNKVQVFKYSEHDVLLWRLFVWDKLKAKQYAGEEIQYADIM